MKVFALGSVIVLAIVLAATALRSEDPIEDIFGVHIGAALLHFEIYRNGEKIHEFHDDIRDDANLSKRWDLVAGAELPEKIVIKDKEGGASLSGLVEIRMLHAGKVISKASVADIQLEAGEKAGTWKMKKSQLARVKKAAVQEAAIQ